MTDKSSVIPKIIEGIQERKGRGITVIDLSEVENSGVDSFVICQGTSPTHVAAVADSIREHLHEKYGIKPYNYDGYRNAQWIVIDYGPTLVHVFTPENRLLYNLEELWSDGKISTVPDLD
ncbi:MAG: ribosome silencing factor [Muribaculaceae bacterium]|nr:ribosome silencing factor [Muribaculaceae bacterium]